MNAIKKVVSPVKRALSKSNLDQISSPYLPNQTNSFISQKPRIKSRSVFFSHSSTLMNLSPSKLTQTLDTKNSEKVISSNIESALFTRLNNLTSSKSNLEDLDNIYLEIMNYFESFKPVLTLLRLRYEEQFRKIIDDECKKKIVKLSKENEFLLKKINSLSSLFDQVNEENEKLKKDQEGYSRIFNENPEYIVNYKNIVDQMLIQSTVIEKIKKKNKYLKRKVIEMSGLLRNMKGKSAIRDVSPF